MSRRYVTPPPARPSLTAARREHIHGRIQPAGQNRPSAQLRTGLVRFFLRIEPPLVILMISAALWTGIYFAARAAWGWLS